MRIAQFESTLAESDYPYDLPKIKQEFVELSELGFQTKFDQEFVEFCVESVSWRIQRLQRLVELEAPESVVRVEYAWLIKTFQRLQLALVGKDWTLSDEEKEQLDLLAELAELAELEDEEQP